MTATILTWYLLVAFTSTNSMAAIPQRSQADCEQQRKYIMDNRYNTNVPSFAYCVFGAKP